jgi:predicted  nucleic acid-binding Zn-ribbon protein
MNTSIAALLELQVIDKRRLALRRGREEHLGRQSEAAKAAEAAEAAVVAARAEVDKYGALSRQYAADIARCETTIADQRAKQPEAKTNKDYMDIINGIEAAKLEKVKRESSVKELAERLAQLGERVTKLAEAAAKAQEAHAVAQAAAAAAGQPSAEEIELEAQYQKCRSDVDPAFLEVYERLVKAHHRSPLMRVDPASRSTPLGAVLSFNQIEQIRMGKLVVDRASNAILYLADGR